MTRNPLRALRKLIRTKRLFTKRRTLISLPVELIQMIGMKLIDHSAYEQLAIPQSTPNGRQAVYNTRLSCRSLRDAFEEVFMEILYDMPYRCTEESLGRLIQLLQVPEVPKKFRQLTIVGADIVSLEVQERQAAWIKQNLTSTFRTILNLIPHLTSVRCIPVNEYNFEREDGVVVDSVGEENLYNSIVILESFQSALRTTVHAAAMESFTLRCSYGNNVKLEEAINGTIRGRVTIVPLLENPHYHLQHLTVGLECLQTYGVNGPGHIALPDLATLTIILTRPEIDHEEMLGLDILASTMPQQLTFTGCVSVSTSQLYSLVSPFSTRHKPPSHLVLCQIAIRLKHHHHDPNPPRPIGFAHNFRIGIFEVRDVTWNRYVSRRSRRKSEGWCETGWDLFPYLCELADVVRVRNSLGEYENFLERPDGVLEIEGFSDLEEGPDQDEGIGTD